MIDNVDIKTLIKAGKKLGLKTEDIDITYLQFLELINVNRDPIEIACNALNVGRYLGYIQSLQE